MNSKFILKLIKPYVIEKRLSEDIFEETFKALDLHEKYSVIDILIANDIEIDYDVEEIKLDTIDTNEGSLKNLPKKYEYKPIINSTNLSNEHLCLLFQKGDERALDLLYIKNQRFIWKKANKIGARYSHNLDDEDLVSYGFFGLRTAALKFDISLENKFLTYAGHWINQSITRAIADFGFTIRVPVHMFDNINYTNRISRDFNFKTEIELINYICKDKGVDESKVREWFLIAQNILKPTSLNINIGEDQNTQLIDLLANHEEAVENQCESESLQYELLEYIECLKPRETEIIKMRFGFGCDQMTLEEVGKHYEVTRERIRQIEVKAIKKLMKMKDIKDLKVYLED